MAKFPFARTGPLLLAALWFLMGFLAACADTAEMTPSSKSPLGEAGEPSFAQFTDIPIPAAAKLDLDKTLILGAREAWVGRLAITTSASTTELYDFYHREMPRFGWAVMTLMRGVVSVLTYSRANRIATVQITRSTLGGARVNLTVSPREPMKAPAR